MALEVKVKILLRDCSEGKAGTITATMNNFINMKTWGALFASGAEQVIITGDLIGKDTFKKCSDRSYVNEYGIPLRELTYLST